MKRPKTYAIMFYHTSDSDISGRIVYQNLPLSEAKKTLKALRKEQENFGPSMFTFFDYGNPTREWGYNYSGGGGARYWIQDEDTLEPSKTLF